MNKPRILIVEDEAVIAMDIEEALRALNFQVTGRTSTGESALALITKNKPDLVLMDIHLEGSLDGIETAAKIKSQYNIPVVFLTAFADRQTLDRVKVLEPYGYIVKPFRQVELRTTIELALHKHSLENSRSRATSVTNEPSNVPDFKSTTASRHQPSTAMQQTIISLLESIEPFSKLSSKLNAAIAASCLIQNYDSGAHFSEEGDPQEDGFMLIDGRVAIYKTSAGGKELVVELLNAMDTFGILSALDQAPLPFSAKTLQPSRILWMPREIIMYVVDSFPELRSEIFHRVLTRLRKAYDLSRALAHDKVDVRIASALLAISDNPASKESNNNHLKLDLTRQELGEVVGTTPETVSRVLSKFVAEGLVDLSESGSVKIQDWEKLSKILGPQY